MDGINKIGHKVRFIRETRNLSVKDVSERANLAVQTITDIEDGNLIPGLTPLIKIARVLGVRLGTFLDDEENIGPSVTRHGQKTEVTRFSDRSNAKASDLDFYSLAQNKAGRHMDPFIIDVFPDSGKDVRLSTHEGEEFIYVMSGCIEVIYGKEKYELYEGDSIYYDSIIAHHLHAADGKPAKILAVVYTPY